MLKLRFHPVIIPPICQENLNLYCIYAAAINVAMMIGSASKLDFFMIS